MAGLSAPDTSVRRSFQEAMAEFAAEGRGAEHDDSLQRVIEVDGGRFEDERSGQRRFWVPTG